jgi:acetylserotonin O-methyltransferase
MNLPSPQPVLFLIEAFRRSQAMFTAVELQVFDQLHHAPLGVSQMATLLKANPDALERLLNTCVALQLMDLNNGQYANSAIASAYLTRSSPQSLVGYIEYSQKALWQLWARLPDAVQQGTHRWEQVFGGQGELFSHYYKTEEDKRRFVMGMHAFGLISSPQVVRAFDLSRFHHLVDLGGATGHLPIAACEAYPQMRATVFDLAQVLPVTQEILEAANLSARINTQAGDFFADEFPQADLFTLGRILHDWTRAKIDLLLQKIYATLPPGGAVLIAEKLIDESGVAPIWGLLQSLNMLVVTEGKERKLTQYKEILTAIGFVNIEGIVLPESPLDAIIAYKPV